MTEKANWKLYTRATKNGLRKQLGEVKKKKKKRGVFRAEVADGIELGRKGKRGLNGMS